MKRLLCLLLVLCLVLAGCGKKTAEAEPTESPTAAPTAAPTEAPTEAPTDSTEPPTEAPTGPPAPHNPLTGEPLEEEYTGRPVAFSLNNISVCLPQYGLDDVDWLFEVETEGGITRCIGLMTDPASAETIGPIRSCRSYFVNVSASYNAPLFHCGSSVFAKEFYYSATERLDSWDHADQMGNGGKYFYRDSRGGGYALEHTLFTSGERLAKGMEELGFNTTSDAPVSYGYQFAEKVSLDGQTANEVSIKFYGGKRTTMEYDAETGLYLAHQYGQDWVDGSTGENAAFRNIVVINTDQSMADNGLTLYDLDGSGDGWFATGGKIIPIKWHHEGVEGPFRFTLKDGTTPITFGIGSTYCAIAEGSVTAE